MLRALLVNDTSLIGHHGSAVVVDRLTALASEAGVALERGHGWRAIGRRGDVSGYDLLLVNGEGSLHHETRTARRIAEFVAAVGPRAPVYVVNTICEDLAPELLAKLKPAKGFVARDRESLRALGAAGLPAVYAPDVTLTLQGFASRGGGRLAVTDSVRPDASQALAAAARRVDAVRLRFDAEPGPDVSDPLGLKRLRRRIALRWRSSAEDRSIARTPGFLRYLCDDVSGLVSGRFHGACLAIATGTPFLAVTSNTRKVENLLDEAGLAGRRIDLARLADYDLAPPAFTAEEQGARNAFLKDATARWRAAFAEIAGARH